LCLPRVAAPSWLRRTVPACGIGVLVVYLHCPVDKQLERTHKDSNRPLLKTDNPRQRLLDLFEIREPIYRSLADCVVDTGQASSRSVVRQILKAHERAHSRQH